MDGFISASGIWVLTRNSRKIVTGEGRKDRAMDDWGGGLGPDTCWKVVCGGFDVGSDAGAICIPPAAAN